MSKLQISAGRRHRPLLGLFVVAALTLAVLVVINFRRPESGPVPSVLNRSLGTEPESLDPHKARTKQAGDVLRDIGEGLVGYRENGELIPTGADHWEVSDDGRVYRFFLRTDARWSTGEPVTADDYAYSFRRLVDPATAAFYAELLTDVENAPDIITGDRPPSTLGVTADDEFELTINLRHPVPYFLALLTSPAAYPVHPASVERFGDAYARPGNLPSNGAYRLEKWIVGSLIELTRNEYYRDDASTAIDIVRDHIITEPGTELNRYRTGEIDITANVPPDAFETVRRERPGELRVSPFLGVYFYGFNLRRPPFKDNPKLRAALSMAIDREVLTETVTGRGETPAYSWVPPGVDNYEPRSFYYAAMSRDERHAAARQLYHEAGYDASHPAEIELRYNTAGTTERIAVAIQGMWHDVLGFEARLINEEFQVLLSNIRAGEVTEVFRSSWMGDYNDANTFLYMMRSDSPSNMFGFHNTEFDALLERANNQTDPMRRRWYLEEAERVLLSEHPVIPIYFYVSKHLVSPCVAGWGDNMLDYHYSQYLSLIAESRERCSATH